MTALVIVGAQWGDEGKGKIVDRLAEQAHQVVRYGGGANAGHTLVVDGDKVVFHLVPSGALHERPRCLLGAGMVLDLAVLTDELAEMKKRGLLTDERVLISERAHVVMPHHKLMDGLRERGPRAIGTTKRGIGPCYQDRAARRGVRMGDFRDEAAFSEKLAANIDAWRPAIEALGGEALDADQIREDTLTLARPLLQFVGSVSDALHEARGRGERLLLEGAQGTMLDIDHGTYPFVTSSAVTAGGACTGSGLGPTHIDRVLGISKAYTTRVGEGPFPTELEGEVGERLRKAGAEFGATTGRPRRCGWLDIPVLRHAVRVNGLTEFAFTKLDVLSGIDPLRIAVAYELDGKRLSTPPANGLATVMPVYEELPGFDGDITGTRDFAELPKAARAYVTRVEELAGCPMSIVSVGPGRSQTIVREDPWR